MFPVFLDGPETWSVKAKNRCFSLLRRGMLRISRTENRTNKPILKHFGVYKRLFSMRYQRCLQIFAHIVRQEEKSKDNISRKMHNGSDAESVMQKIGQ